MKIIFIGSVFFSKLILEKMIKLNINIVGVCCKKKSSFNSDFFDIGKISLKNKISTIYTNNVNGNKFYKWAKNKKADYIFCIGWSNLLGKKILNIPLKGTIGYHPSKLPLNKGRHPIIWAILLGLKETASTFFFMTEKPDSGKIISQKSVIISFKDNSFSLYNKLASTAQKQIKHVLKNLKRKNIKNEPNIKKSNYWRKRNSFDGKIDWRMSAVSIYNTVRALDKPYIGAHFFLNKRKIIIWKSKIINYKINNIEPGKFLFYKNSYPVIKCGVNAICLLKTNYKIKFKKGDYL